jgi:hypothetical protein
LTQGFFIRDNVIFHNNLILSYLSAQYKYHVFGWITGNR